MKEGVGEWSFQLANDLQFPQFKHQLHTSQFTG